MKRFLIIAGVVAALAVGIVAVAGVGAQEATPDVSDDAASDEERPIDHYLEVLAGNLGVSVEDLEAALTQTQLDLVAEKVEDGTLTQEEADEIIERIESGEGRLFPPFAGKGPNHHGLFHRIAGSIFDAAAEVLGMDSDELHQQVREEGLSLADVAESQGVDVETFKADLLAALQADLDEKVADGTITQKMADRISQNLEESIDRIVEKAPGDGPWGGRPFRGGPGFGGPDEDAETATTTTFFN